MLNLTFGLKLDNMIRFQSVDVPMATSSAMDEALNIHPQPNIIAAKRVIADFLGYPLAKLTSEQMADIDEILAQTLQIKEVMAKIRDYFQTSQERQNAQ